MSSRGGDTTQAADPSCFAAVFEGTGSAAGEVGVAAISLASPGLILCQVILRSVSLINTDEQLQFSDTKTYPSTITKLLSLNPSVVLVPDTGHKSVKLFDDIAAKLPSAAVQRLHRKYFNESRGLQTIKQLMVAECSSVEMQFHNKYYCLAAANSLLKVSKVPQSICNIQYK